MRATFRSIPEGGGLPRRVSAKRIEYHIGLRTTEKPHVFVAQPIHHEAGCVTGVDSQGETSYHLTCLLHEINRIMRGVNLPFPKRRMNKPERCPPRVLSYSPST